MVALVAALALFVGVTAADAGTVRWFGGGCWNQDPNTGNIFGGTATTSPGPLTVSFGWATSSYGYTQKFLDVQYITYSVNGGTPTTTPVGSLTGWSPIAPTTNSGGTKLYFARWTSPVIASLASGDSVTVTMSLKTTKTVYDDAKTSYPAGRELLQNPDVTADMTTCTITAT